MFKKGLLQRLQPILDGKKILPDHQFGFRHQYSSIEQVHRIVHVIQETLEKNYCSAVVPVPHLHKQTIYILSTQQYWQQIKNE